MRTLTLIGFLADIERRKAGLEVDESARAVDALRNKGTGRTAEKRAIIQRARARARLAGVKPVRSYT
jgi:hypothetical protein